ncbi:MAG TPA: MFS transporter [Mycobacteriales bacterium]|nr:MFS transporter [Mycobacteriales bacterium]
MRLSEVAGRRWALSTVCAVLFLTMLDSTIVSVTLPSLRSDLQVGVSGLQWVVSAYVLVFAALMLTGGTLGDLYGRRRLMAVGVVLFVAGSALSALAPSLDVVYAGRVLQGVGAAASEPGTLSVLRQLYPDQRERARAIGIWAGVSGLALALGPVLGGLLVAAGSWRTVFWFNVGFGVVALLAALRFVPESADPAGRAIDLPGQVSGAAALGLLTFGLIRGQSAGFASPRILGLFAAALVAAAVFGLIERRAASPVLQLGLFRNRTYSAANLVAFAVNFGVFAIFLFLSLFLQLVRDASALGTAARFVPMTAAMIVAAPLTGRWVARIGPRWPLTVGLVVATAGMLATDAVLTRHADLTALAFVLPVLGVGLGMVLAPVTSAVMAGAPRARSGMAAATTNASRQIGAVVGVTVLGAVVNAELTGSLHQRLVGLRLPADIQAFALHAVTSGQTAIPTSLLGHPGAVHDIDVALSAGRDAFLAGLHVALLTAAGVLLAAALVALVGVRNQPAAD